MSAARPSGLRLGACGRSKTKRSAYIFSRAMYSDPNGTYLRRDYLWCSSVGAPQGTLDLAVTIKKVPFYSAPFLHRRWIRRYSRVVCWVSWVMRRSLVSGAGIWSGRAAFCCLPFCVWHFDQALLGFAFSVLGKLPAPSVLTDSTRLCGFLIANGTFLPE